MERSEEVRYLVGGVEGGGDVPELAQLVHRVQATVIHLDNQYRFQDLFCFRICFVWFI